MSNDNTVFVGLDVHKDSICVAHVAADFGAVVLDYGSIGTQQHAIRRMVRKLTGRGARPLFAYEAGPCGFWLHRLLTGW